MNKSAKRGVAVTVALLLLTTTFGSSVWAWDPSYPELWKEYQNQYRNYFPMGVTAQASDIGIAADALDLNGQIGHHFNKITVLDFNMALHMGADNNNPSALLYDQRTSEVALMTANNDVKVQQYRLANTAVVTATPPGVKAVLDAIRAYNNNPANIDDQRYVRINGLFTGDIERTPLYFFCNGYRYDPVNPDWADYETIRLRIENYLQSMFELYLGYGDIIVSIDLVEDLFDSVGNLTGQWGYNQYPVATSPNYYGSGGHDINKWPVEWEHQYNVDSIVAEVLLNDIFRDAAADVPATLYWNETFPLDNTAARAKLDFVKSMIPKVPNLGGFGINAHLSSGINTINAFETQITELSTVKSGMELAVTKMDISTNLTGGGVALWQPTDSKAVIDPLTVNDAVMKRQADYAEDVMRMLIRNSDKIVAVNWDGVADNKNTNPLNGASLWSSTDPTNLSSITKTSVNGVVKSAVHMEKWAFYAVLGTPIRINLEFALSTGPAINAANEAIYTQVTWDRYVESKRVGQIVYNDRIYDIVGYWDTKAAIQEIWDAIKGLELRKATDFTPPAVWVPVSFYDGTYQIQVDTGGLAATFTYSVANEAVATVDDNGLITFIKGGLTQVTITMVGVPSVSKHFMLNVEYS